MSPPAPDPTPRLVPSPEQLRGLAHPIRLQALDALRLDGPSTATELARRLGVNSGATSYHLRQLAAYGYIEEATELGTRRDRYWRAHTVVAAPQGAGDGPGALEGCVVACTHLLQESLAERAALPDAWAAACRTRQDALELTPGEAEALLARIAGLLDEAREAAEGASPKKDPPRSAYVVQVHAFPRPGATTA